MADLAGRAGMADDLSADLLQQAAATFGLLASTMRLHIVWVLAHEERDVGSIADQVGGTLQTVSQHLAKLKLAGLVRSRRQGRHQVYLLDDPRLIQIVREMVGRLRDQQSATGRVRDVGA